MPIDPKKIARWRGTLRVAQHDPAHDDVSFVLCEALPALLAEREELLALLREAMSPKPNVVGIGGVLVAAGCAFCAGVDGEHQPDCRGAAFLRE